MYKSYETLKGKNPDQVKKFLLKKQNTLSDKVSKALFSVAE